MIEEISASENKFLHLFMWILRQHMQNLGGGGGKSTKPGTKQPIPFVIRYLFQSATIFPKTELEEEFPTKLEDEWYCGKLKGEEHTK